MRLTAEEIKKIAHLARLTLSDDEIVLYTEQLSNILNFIEQMNQCDTTQAASTPNPLETAQRLRPDLVSEVSQRELFQAIAPQVEAGLYLVPKVLEDE